MSEPTPGRAALDDLRFELKKGDVYEQHLASRIEDALDAQTQVWLAYRAAQGLAGIRAERESLDRREVAEIQRARAEGMSWEAIAAGLGLPVEAAEGLCAAVAPPDLGGADAAV